MNLLINKTAIITGSSGLIGQNIVKIFARNKCNIIACMRKENVDLEKKFKEIAIDNNVSIDIYYFDLEEIDQIKDFAKKIKATKQTIDILINNAGFAKDTLVQLTTTDHLKKMMAINFYGTFELTKYILKLMRKSGAPTIVNISSVAALDIYPGMFGYSISKEALNDFTKRLAMENNFVRCNVVAPGFIETKMLDQSITNNNFLDEVINSSCMKRLGQPEEIANAALFLSSELSSYITGQVLRVDGGIYRGL